MIDLVVDLLFASCLVLFASCLVLGLIGPFDVALALLSYLVLSLSV